ncbi:bifunctional hydroxymethylpyrimidine kinase/phosphomethylpyrimidine kinase [Gulosibacter macacae]|uniref:pyridoxal kinase n=1 Tax=Gulosibacter macacae TaxID=2488791 RepID=A0A3P3VXV9_9MICO|nr:PfkB family carbohydrate kinase [Gulosibacter macacae]RRJ86309.1 bifunctional hydroxymethylpyrimidine kinase/phosphomethylpyrimidine kinase [Gulosibacter macacae]
MIPNVLTIAGSEASGGAGAQVDLRTFHQLGTFGSAALTLIVSFDPEDGWKHRVHPIPPEVTAAQVEAAFGVHEQLDTVKIGMLGSVPMIETVARILDERQFRNVIVDPVLICKGQEASEALDVDNALRELILPRATVVTPNLFETEVLSGHKGITTVDELIEAARAIADQGVPHVYAKLGIDQPGTEATDVFVSNGEATILSAPKFGQDKVSGAGCTLAAALTAELAKGYSPLDAARAAKQFTTAAVAKRRHGGAPFSCAWQGEP